MGWWDSIVETVSKTAGDVAALYSDEVSELLAGRTMASTDGGAEPKGIFDTLDVYTTIAEDYVAKELILLGSELKDLVTQNSDAKPVIEVLLDVSESEEAGNIELKEELPSGPVHDVDSKEMHTQNETVLSFIANKASAYADKLEDYTAQAENYVASKFASEDGKPNFIDRTDQFVDENIVNIGLGLQNIISSTSGVDPYSFVDQAENYLEKIGDNIGCKITSLLNGSAQKNNVEINELYRKNAVMREIIKNPETFVIDLLKDFPEPYIAGTKEARFFEFKLAYNFDNKKADESIKEYPELQRMVNNLVPLRVSINDFWMRYYFVVSEICLKDEQMKVLIGNVALDEDFKWDSDDEESGTSLNNIKSEGNQIAKVKGINDSAPILATLSTLAVVDVETITQIPINTVAQEIVSVNVEVAVSENESPSYVELTLLVEELASSREDVLSTLDEIVVPEEQLPNTETQMTSTLESGTSQILASVTSEGFVSDRTIGSSIMVPEPGTEAWDNWE